MPRLRLLHLVHNLPPEFRGGTESYVEGLAARQQARGLDVTILCGSEERRDGPARRERLCEVPVVRVFRRDDEPYGVDFRPAQPRQAIADEVARLRPDLLHVHHWFNLGDDLLQQLPGLPAVATFHDSYAACPRFFFLRPDGFFCGDDLPVPVERCVECLRPDDGHADLDGRVRARRARFAGEVARLHTALAPSEYHADLLVRAGLVPAAKMRALPLGLADPPPRSPHVPAPAPGRLRLVSFGHLGRLKGTDLLIEAVRQLAPICAVELHLFGEPLAADAAALRAASTGLPIHWHGGYDLARLSAAAGGFDLAAFPSRAHETFSLVVEEAIAVGLPLLTSDRGAPARRVAGFGATVPVADERALVATLRRFHDQPGLLAAMRRSLPAKPFLLDDHEAALRAIYAEAVAAGPRP